jgi:prepilin-type N-terminal cleavage/methylation domain-containing protein
VVGRAAGDAGYSLVEIAVTVAVIGVLSAIAIPTMLGVMPRARLSGNTQTLAKEVSLIRGRAISKGTKFKIVFSPADERYTLWRKSATECAATANWCQVAGSTMAGTDLVDATNFRDDKTLIADWDGSMNIFFDERGLITLQTPPRPPATVAQYQKRVVVEPTGRVFVERSEDGGAHWARE